MTSDPVRVLLVEDDLEDLLLTRELFAGVSGIKVQLDHVTTYETALEAMARREHEIYLLDYQLGVHTGLELLREAHDRGWDTPAILLTGQGDREVDLEAMRCGAADYLSKGRVTVDTLERSLRYTLAQARAQKDLRASERRLRAVYESTRDALVVFESEGQYCVEANPAACDLLGLPRTQLIGRTLSGEAPPRLLYPPRWHEVLSDGRVRGELRFERTDGSCRDIEFLVTVNFLPGYDLSVMRDVTDNKRLEEQYHRIEKFADIGRAALGVARDLHSQVEKLAAINAALMAETPSGRSHELVQQANESLERVSHLAKQLLTVAGQSSGSVGLVNLNMLVGQLGETLVRMLGENVELTTRMDPNTKPFPADATEVERVILNLVEHARNALLAGGKLVLETGRIEIVEGQPSPHPALSPGKFTVLRVSDTGRGLDETTLARLLPVMGTDKTTAQAEGPGLETAARLVRRMGGVFEVHSDPQLGTNCVVYWPSAVAASPGPRASRIAPVG